MAVTQREDIRDQDGEKPQEKKRRLEPAPVPMKALADESVPFPGLLGVSAVEPSLESHAAFLGDPRFSHPANNVQRARMVTELQGTYGNQYVQRLVESLDVQAKLTIGSPDDQYEREADGVADTVTRASAPSIQRQAEEEGEEEIQAKPIAEQITPLVQKQEEELIQTKLTNDIQVQRQAQEPEKEEEGPIQAKRARGQNPLISPSLQSRINSLKGGGQPLPESTRKYFEPRFGYDFSGVRVHKDSKASETAKTINSKAFTTGTDIVFAAGQYEANSSTGKRLLAHELTHVVQQQAAPALQRKGAAEAPKARVKTPSVRSKQALKALWDVAVTNNVREALAVMARRGLVRRKATKAAELILKSCDAIDKVKPSYSNDHETLKRLDFAHHALYMIRVGFLAHTRKPVSVKDLLFRLSVVDSVLDDIKARL